MKKLMSSHLAKNSRSPAVESCAGGRAGGVTGLAALTCQRDRLTIQLRFLNITSVTASRNSSSEVSSA